MSDDKRTREIPAWLRSRLQPDDFERIARVVAEVERKTSGELVPVILRRSSTIGHVPLTLFLLLMILEFLTSWTAQLSEMFFTTNWLFPLYAVLAWGLSRWGARFEVLQRLLTPKGDQAWQVEQRAELEFFESNIRATKAQTGILLLVSLMERQAVVLADQAIAEKLPAETWQEVIRLITEGVRQEKLATGLERGIQRCGEILEQTFPVEPGDENELPDHIIIKES